MVDNKGSSRRQVETLVGGAMDEAPPVHEFTIFSGKRSSWKPLHQRLQTPQWVATVGPPQEELSVWKHPLGCPPILLGDGTQPLVAQLAAMQRFSRKHQPKTTASIIVHCLGQPDPLCKHELSVKDSTNEESSSPMDWIGLQLVSKTENQDDTSTALLAAMSLDGHVQVFQCQWTNSEELSCTISCLVSCTLPSVRGVKCFHVAGATAEAAPSTFAVWVSTTSGGLHAWRIPKKSAPLLLWKFQCDQGIVTSLAPLMPLHAASANPAQVPLLLTIFVYKDKASSKGSTLPEASVGQSRLYLFQANQAFQAYQQSMQGKEDRLLVESFSHPQSFPSESFSLKQKHSGSPKSLSTFIPSAGSDQVVAINNEELSRTGRATFVVRLCNGHVGLLEVVSQENSNEDDLPVIRWKNEWCLFVPSIAAYGELLMMNGRPYLPCCLRNGTAQLLPLTSRQDIDQVVLTVNLPLEDIQAPPYVCSFAAGAVGIHGQSTPILVFAHPSTGALLDVYVPHLLPQHHEPTADEKDIPSIVDQEEMRLHELYKNGTVRQVIELIEDFFLPDQEESSTLLQSMPSIWRQAAAEYPQWMTWLEEQGKAGRDVSLVEFLSTAEGGTLRSLLLFLNKAEPISPFETSPSTGSQNLSMTATESQSS